MRKIHLGLLLMNYCYRLIINCIILVTIHCCLFVSPVYSLPKPDLEATSNQFLRQGVENIRLGKFQKAIDNFTQVIESDANLNSAYSNRCLAYLQLEEYHNAVADCTVALNFAPKNIEAYLNRGLAEYRLGNYQAAILDNNRAIQLKPYDFRAYYNRGIVNAALNNHYSAIKDYNLALTQTPELSSYFLGSIYNDRGLVNFESQNISAALLDFSTAIRLNSTDDRAYFNRGCVCAKSKDDWGAVRDFGEVIKLNPQNAVAYVNRGVAYHHLGYEQAAITDLQIATAYFISRGETIAYQRTTKLIENVQREIASRVEIALGEL